MRIYIHSLSELRGNMTMRNLWFHQWAPSETFNFFLTMIKDSKGGLTNEKEMSFRGLRHFFGILRTSIR